MSVTEELYDELRPLAFAVAYRMLGSVAEAEDVVQESLLRLHRADGIDSPRAYVTTVATRLAIDALRSARARRERYPGQWLPEPLPTGEAVDPAERAESLSFAFLVLLESLTPVERAVFLLRDVFDFEYAEIAEIVGKSEDNCRQLAARARRRLEERPRRFEVSPAQRDELAARFFAAAGDGDVEGLVRLLADDAAVYGDGGGRAPTAPEPVRGRERVARFLAGVGRRSAELGLRPELVELNGEAGAVFRDGEGRVTAAVALELAGGRVAAVRNVLNPEKLRHLGPVVGLVELLEARRTRRG